MKANLKNIVVLSLMIGFFGSAVADSQNIKPGTPKTYHYEITGHGIYQPLTIAVGVGMENAVTIEGASQEYVAQMVSVPSSTWRAMVREKKTPEHDFVECNMSVCSYGKKAQVSDRTIVAIRVDERSGKFVTTGKLDRQLVEGIGSIKTQGIGIDLPNLSSVSATQRATLAPGDVLTLFAETNGDSVKIRLAAVD